MGMYTGIRFKGYVKEEHKDSFEEIAMNGNWEDSDISELQDFGNCFGRASFIPCGSLSYMPDSWEKYDNSFEYLSSEWFRSAKDTDGFDRKYDKDSGYWTFQCSLKNYEDEIEHWFEILPLFIDKIEHLEYYYEEWDWSRRFDLVDDKIICVEDSFIRYYD